MQMVDGRHLSGDRSFKLTKCVMSGGSKAFCAIYCVLNEYSQVVAWWFTNGTSMAELETAMVKISKRYKLYGYDGPHSATTDRCCQERTFWTRVFGLNDNPIETEFLEEEDVSEIEVVKAPFDGQVASTIGICGIFVGSISEELKKLPIEQQVIAVDGEWKLGHSKMDVLIICMPFSYKVYIFQLTLMCSNNVRYFPRPLKSLLQDPTVRKVGNRICSDVAKLKLWDVVMGPTVELGHLASDRALVPSRAPSLASIIDVLFPGVEIDGKGGDIGCPRTSNWSANRLTAEQRQYASNDGYSTAVSYRRLMQIMDPKVEARLLAEDVVDGLHVTIYANRWKSRIACGIVRTTARQKNKVHVEIDVSAENTIFAPGAIVDVVEDDEIIQASIASLQQRQAGSVIVQCSLLYCRRNVDHVGAHERVTINTEKKTVLVDQETYDQIHYMADEGSGNDNVDNESSSQSSAGSNDRRAMLPRNLRRRKNYFRKQKVKNDIAHVFMRFRGSLVKSMEHITALSRICAMLSSF